MTHTAKIIITVIEDEGHVDTSMAMEGNMSPLMMFNTLLALAAAYSNIVEGKFEDIKIIKKVDKP